MTLISSRPPYSLRNAYCSHWLLSEHPYSASSPMRSDARSASHGRGLLVLGRLRSFCYHSCAAEQREVVACSVLSLRKLIACCKPPPDHKGQFPAIQRSLSDTVKKQALNRLTTNPRIPISTPNDGCAA